MAEKKYIECEAAINVVLAGDIDKDFPRMDIAARLHDIPAADVRPVVLCRDCKHKGWVQEPEHGKSVDYCHLIERCVDKQFFCAAGEKREES